MDERKRDTERIITAHYDAHSEDERFASKHGSVEFTITRQYIDRYLKPGDRLLEVGCATGRYALHYAGRGFSVDAMDLVESNLTVLRKNAGPEDDIRAVQGNALDLSAYSDETFDATLVLGPMYHLFSREDKVRCLSEAVRVTRHGGLIFAAYCQFDASMMQAGFIGGMYGFLIENGLLDERTYLPISNPKGVFELYRREQVDALDSVLDVERLHYVGTDMFTQYYAEQIDAMDDELFEKYIRYTLSICENPHLVGISNHTLDVLRRR